MKKLAICLVLLSTFGHAHEGIGTMKSFESFKHGYEEGMKAADSNAKPAYGESGLPSNCRAYIQYAIDSYRQGQYSADDTMTAMERNCGINGWLWSDSK